MSRAMPLVEQPSRQMKRDGTYSDPFIRTSRTPHEPGDRVYITARRASELEWLTTHHPGCQILAKKVGVGLHLDGVGLHLDGDGLHLDGDGLHLSGDGLHLSGDEESMNSITMHFRISWNPTE